MRVGLLGYNVKTGLGYENRRIFSNLDIVSWLVAEHPSRRFDEDHLLCPMPFNPSATIERLTNLKDTQKALKWVTANQIECIVSVERCIPMNFFDRYSGRKVLLCNTEWIDKCMSYFDNSTLLVARTRQCLALLKSLGYKDIDYCPCPLGYDAPYGFSASRAVHYSAGNHGIHDRKGLPEVIRALKIRPKCIKVFSQKDVEGCPENVIYDVPTPYDLYQGASLAVVPERFNGVGLACIEPMAMGIPILTTNARPMRQYVIEALGVPLARKFLIKVNHRFPVKVWQHRFYASVPCVHDMLDKMDEILAMSDEDLFDVSRKCQQYVFAIHNNWARLWKLIIGK